MTSINIVIMINKAFLLVITNRAIWYMAEERRSSTLSPSPHQQRVILENQAEAHLIRATKIDEQLASSKQPYRTCNASRRDLTSITKSFARGLFVQKPKHLKPKKNRDRVYDKEARDHAFKHARILAELRP